MADESRGKQIKIQHLPFCIKHDSKELKGIEGLLLSEKHGAILQQHKNKNTTVKNRNSAKEPQIRRNRSDPPASAVTGDTVTHPE